MKEPSGKKTKTPSRKKKLVGPECAYIRQAPTEVEISTERGERLTRLTFTFLPCPLTFSADKMFARAFNEPMVLLDPEWWLVIKPWLENTEVEVEAFWTKFNTAEAMQERIWCTNGDKSITWMNERLLIDMVHITKKLLSGELKAPQSMAIFPLEVELMNRMASWVMNAVESDPPSLRRLQTLLKNPKAANDTTNREIINRNVFGAFARLASVEHKLPTKKQVREGAYIADDDNGRRIAARAYEELGLSGLQKG